MIELIDEWEPEIPTKRLNIIDEALPEAEVFHLVIQSGWAELPSALILPDADWVRQLTPRIVDAADGTENHIESVVRASVDGAVHVNVVKTELPDGETLPDTLERVNQLLRMKNFRSKASGRSGSAKKMIRKLNVIILNLIHDAEATTPTSRSTSDPISGSTSRPEVDQSIPFIQRPPAAMEKDYLIHQKLPESEAEAEAEDTKISYVAPPKSRPSPSSANDIEAQGGGDATSTVSFPEAVKVVRKGIGIRMKWAIQTIAGMAVGVWWPAVTSLGRRKRCLNTLSGQCGSVRAKRDAPEAPEAPETPEAPEAPEAGEEMMDIYGRAIDQKWLDILLGKKYSNATEAELKTSVDNWKYRGENRTLTSGPSGRETTSARSTPTSTPVSTRTRIQYLEPEVGFQLKQEVRPEVKTEVIREVNLVVIPQVSPEVKPEVIPDNDRNVIPELNLDVRPELSLDVQPEINLDVKSEVNLEVQPEVNLGVQPEVTPEYNRDVEPELNLDARPELSLGVQPEDIQDVNPAINLVVKPELNLDVNPEVIQDAIPANNLDVKPEISLDVNPEAAGDDGSATSEEIGEAVEEVTPEVTPEAKLEVNTEENWEARSTASGISGVASTDYDLVNNFLKVTLENLDQDFDFTKMPDSDAYVIRKTSGEAAGSSGAVTNSPITYVSLNPLYPPGYVSLLFDQPGSGSTQPEAPVTSASVSSTTTDKPEGLIYSLDVPSPIYTRSPLTYGSSGASSASSGSSTESTWAYDQASGVTLPAGPSTATGSTSSLVSDAITSQQLLELILKDANSESTTSAGWASSPATGSKPSGGWISPAGGYKPTTGWTSSAWQSTTGYKPTTEANWGGAYWSGPTWGGAIGNKRPPLAASVAEVIRKPSEPESGISELLNVQQTRPNVPSEPEAGLPGYQPETGDPIEPEAQLAGIITQLNGNITTGLVGLTHPSAGIHFINSSTDVIDMDPFNSSAWSPFSIQPLPIEAALLEQPLEALLTGSSADGSDAPDAVIVDSVTAQEPPPTQASSAEPDINPNAYLLFPSSDSPLPGFVAEPSGVEVAEPTTVVSSSSSVGSVLAYSLVTLGVAATAYAAVATFPLWVPFLVKKRRRSSYDLPKRRYDAGGFNPDGSSPDGPSPDGFGPDGFDRDISSDELQLSSYLYGDAAYRRARRRKSH